MRRAVSVLAVLPLMFAGCGEASAATRNYQVTDFSKLRVSGPFTVHVHVGGPAVVHATGPQDKIDRLSIEQHDDTLDIRPIRTSGWADMTRWSKEELVIDVGVRTLAEASLAGSGDIVIDRVKGDSLALGLSGSGDITAGAIAVRQLALDATGSGDVTAIGRAETARIALRGSGDVHGDKLMAGTATVNLVGSGDVTLGAQKTVAVTIAGSGDVTVTGPARCTVSRAGSGDVRCAGGGSPGDSD